jgi:D-alanyl-D-alanine carboxypeptidase/D-alanyl-D-alanine-endopeptidase (penicillin-binding protein 4)
MRCKRKHVVPALAAALTILVAVSGMAADRDRLLYHAETLDGRVLSSHGADVLFNPASVVKVGTSLWALDRYGPEYRFRTVFGVEGSWSKASGQLDGELVVEGWGDPDFQVENVFLVAQRLNQIGLKKVNGSLRVDGVFWLGWENGVERRVVAPRDRANLMGRRLRAALDPRRWSTTTRASWEAFCTRRGCDPADPPRVEIVGPVRPGLPDGWSPIVLHLSNPLPVVLRRFDVYSNNDIVRIAEVLGGPDALEEFLERRLQVTSDAVDISTASGERRNRITARTAVILLRVFAESLAGFGLSPQDVLPVIGCDPGSTKRKFPRLAGPQHVGSIAVKTGTLTTTDGGVAVLAGYFQTPKSELVLFCVAAPGSGQQELHWRSLQQAWLLDLVEQAGGAAQRPCGPDLPFSDTFAEADWVTPWTAR